MPVLLPKSADTVLQIVYPILMMLLKPFGKLLRSSKAKENKLSYLDRVNCPVLTMFQKTSEVFQKLSEAL